jgi:hypothetical protein
MTKKAAYVDGQKAFRNYVRIEGTERKIGLNLFLNNFCG